MCVYIYIYIYICIHRINISIHVNDNGIQALLKIDVTDPATRKIWIPEPYEFLGEPLFVAKKGAKAGDAEDDIHIYLYIDIYYYHYYYYVLLLLL